MRAVVVAPGPWWSVHDVWVGICEGLEANGVRVTRFNFDDRLRFFERARFVRADGSLSDPLADHVACELATESLLAQVMGVWPDVVIVVSGFFVAPWFFPLARQRGIPVVLWDTEAPYELDRACAIARHCAMVVTNDPVGSDALRLFCRRSYYIPHAYRPAVHCPGDGKPDWAGDVAFAGTGFPSRIEWFERVDWTGITLRLAGMWTGVGPDSPLARHVLVDQGMDNTDTVTLYRSCKLGLSLYRREVMDGIVAHNAGWAMSPRDVEMAATGLFSLRQARGEADGVLGMLPVLDDDPAGVRDQIMWWLAHDDERERRAMMARAAVADRTFAKTTATFLRLLHY